MALAAQQQPPAGRTFAQPSAGPSTKQSLREVAPKERRIRQGVELLNKTELAFFDYVRVLHAGHEVQAQSMRFRLANGSWFKPDFTVPALRLAYEVKGPFAYRGGFEFLKMAATQHRDFTFFLVWKLNGEWVKQEVKP